MRIMSATRPLQVLASCQETFTTGAREHEQHPWCRAVVLAQSARVRGRRAPVFPTRSGVGGSLHPSLEPGKTKKRAKVDRKKRADIRVVSAAVACSS